MSAISERFLSVVVISKSKPKYAYTLLTINVMLVDTPLPTLNTPCADTFEVNFLMAEATSSTYIKSFEVFELETSNFAPCFAL